MYNMRACNNMQIDIRNSKDDILLKIQQLYPQLNIHFLESAVSYKGLVSI